MLKRKIEKILKEWENTRYGLLIDGARQIGKSYSIRSYLENNFDSYVELNLLENKKAVSVLSQAIDSRDFMLRLSSLIDAPLEKGKTAIFIDEIQEFKNFDIITMSKFLVESGEYRFVFSGSLLGVEQYGIDSWPEGYMMLEKMYPLDFEEFLWANNVSKELIGLVRECYVNKNEVPNYLHEKFMDLFRKYLLVGGMPDAVNTFLETNDFNRVSLSHKVIEQYYKNDVAKYASESDKILIKTMYDLIPSELNNQSKRFKLADIPNLKRNENLGLSFGWFTKAGIAIPTYNVNELSIPLELASNRKLVKLFHADTGILTYLMMNPETKKEILDRGIDIHFGAIYENAVAEMITANGHQRLYYYSKKGIGEVDFIIENGNRIVPIEVKSGKDYDRHSALNNFIRNDHFNRNISHAIVLSNENVKTPRIADNIEGKIVYLPVYMAMFI